jgi:hypothetical protein
MTLSLSMQRSLLYAKPLKRDRPNLKRKREIKRKDKKISKETETYVCEGCGAETKTDPAHVVPRRFQKLRHDPTNIKRKCRKCHDAEKHDPAEQRAAILKAYQP